MPEESTNNAESAPPVDSGGADPNNPYGYPMEDVEEGKLFAILSYIIPIVFIVPLIQKDNNFSLFHAKQVLLLVLAANGMFWIQLISRLALRDERLYRALRNE